MIKEAKKAGASQKASCKVIGISPKTIQRWKCDSQIKDRRTVRKAIPHNKLNKEESEKILEAVNQPEYRNLSPSQIVPLLADKGHYLASESTIYRLLRDKRQLQHRQRSKPRSSYKPKALKAIRPNQIYSWDITYLMSSIRGKFYYLYLILDIYSRKAVGWQVYDRESSELASDVLESACWEEKVDRGHLYLHSDNGGPMKGATMLVTLQRLGVIPSFSRPSVSNDNPYSEALFRTLKYRPTYPEKPFSSLEEARNWVSKFIKWYNTEHLHSGIKFVSPETRHQGLDEDILKLRDQVYKEAKAKNPNRWSKETRNWSKIQEVRLNPEKCKKVEENLRSVS